MHAALSQSTTRTVTGIVKSFEESLPLEGVTVVVKGAGRSSGTQPDGIYYITISDKDSVLVFSLADYHSKEIRISQSNEYNITLAAGADNQFSFTRTDPAFSDTLSLRCCR